MSTVASMGPQHIAAENAASCAARHRGDGASMGPQHIAAENSLPWWKAFRLPWWLQWGRSTSLRKTRTTTGDQVATPGFNGAAAHRCGKRMCFYPPRPSTCYA